ncbi:DUF1080 domain-containing protein [Stieleria sp.]|uniref:3-keto-disaccharide hydrolase n=1 Tax=Stieleria sp. TaxID=2795976 RepID=UPI003563D750
MMVGSIAVHHPISPHAREAATMILRSATFVLLMLSAISLSAGDWVSLVGADSLDGWTKVGGEASYHLNDGVITGKTGPGKNTFLTKGPYADFELEFEVKCDRELNSGVQIRSHLYPKPTPQESKPDRIREQGEMYGYQCEITGKTNGANGCSGNFWDEGRRTKWLDESVNAEEKQAVYKPGQWNQFRIVAKGNRIQSFVNGVPVADFTDDRDAEGLIGLQVHSIKKGSGPYQVSWRNIRIREL